MADAKVQVRRAHDGVDGRGADRRPLHLQPPSMRKAETPPAGRRGSARSAVGSTRRSTRMSVKPAAHSVPATLDMITAAAAHRPRGGGYRVPRPHPGAPSWLPAAVVEMGR